MSITHRITERPLIHVKMTDDHDPIIYHNEDRCRIVFQSDVIRIGCSDVTVEAMRIILAEWEKAFSNTIVYQNGAD